MTTLGKYELHEQLGKGGFGVVYRAVDNIGREVAVKVLKPSFTDDPEATDRFRREALAAGSLFHPHIAAILEFDECDGRLFVVMRYIDGKPLDQIIRERGRLPWEEALKIINDIAGALEFAHGKNFIHRDIKPGNIIVSPEDGAVLTDFGLVKAATTSGLSTSGVMVGTPAYIAPEVWSGQAVSPATDIYSLACVFYEMITGSVLFDGESSPEIMKKHFDELKLPASWPEGTPEGTSAVLEKALSKEPGQRYPSAAAFARALAGCAPASEAPGWTGVDDAANIPAAPGDMGTAKKWPWKKIAIGLGLIAAAGLTLWLAAPFSERGGTPDPTATAPLEADVEPTSSSGSTRLLPVDGMEMVYVPAGDFLMGSPEGVGDDNEHPQRPVHLDTFWIDKTEVTNAMYAQCVAAGACTKPANYSSNTRGSYYDNNVFADYPVIYVNWNQARDYCAWAGRSLPTEAQWEKAARGTDGRTYAWGNDTPNSGLANYTQKIGDTTAVGSYSIGASPYGALDMTGNVWEWTADWYDDNYYLNGSLINPAGPDTGIDKVLRGGSWNSDEQDMRATRRYRFDPSISNLLYGFRCALANPSP